MPATDRDVTFTGMLKQDDIAKQVMAARAGELSAWNSLYQYYFPRLYSFALQLYGHRAEINDLVQDSFVTAFLKLSQLKDPALFGAWIRKILVHHSFRLLRSQENNAFQQEPVSSKESDWEKQLEEAEKNVRLHAALAQLPETLRSAILLRFYSSHTSYQEIADILSIPVGTVRSRLNEAKLKLTRYWRQPVTHGAQFIEERDAWDQFYRQTLSGIHHCSRQRNIFLQHLYKDAQVMAPGHQLFRDGQQFFAALLADDQACGSYLKPVEVFSCGNISVIEQAHFNSPEHPDHCPPSSVLVLSRKNNRVAQIHMHAGGR